MKNQALTWCSDTRHSIIGCADNAAAQYLTTEATNASSHHSILKSWSMDFAFDGSDGKIMDGTTVGSDLII